MREHALTAETLRQYLNYKPETGVFTWRIKPNRNRCVGAIAGYVNSSRGYCRIELLGKCYQAHRLAWLHTYGTWPTEQIDHINGVRDDNRIANLRECSGAQNMQNLRVYRTNTSGFVGVSWCKRTKRWQAYISLHGKSRRIGSFAAAGEAHAAYLKAKASIHEFQPTLRSAEREAV